jgi:ATP-dependent Clp protease ATP-binding subunit ClpC
VGTGHLLLALIRLDRGTAVIVLRKMGLDTDAIVAEVEKLISSAEEEKVVGVIPYSPRVKKVLAIAGKEVRRWNHTYVGTEHMLLGLIRVGEGVAGRVLQQFKVDLEQTRTEILKELDPNFVPPAA